MLIFMLLQGSFCALYNIIILGRAQPCYQSLINLPERESWALQGASSSSKSRGDVELKFKRTKRADSIGENLST